jgi:hypothetical protein
MSIEANVEDETTISNESDVEDEKTKAPFTPRMEVGTSKPQHKE